MCFIKKNTHLSQLLLETKLIIWDEAPMSDRRCFESLDKTLRDITNNADQLFGGKSMLLGGDFRQTLPVKPKSPKSEILASCLTNSYLWKHFTVLRLTENMRLAATMGTPADALQISWFSNWLLQIGDGMIGSTPVNQHTDIKRVEIPTQFLIDFSTMV